MPALVKATRRRKPKVLPRAVHRAGSPEAIALVRGFVAQQRRLEARGLAEAEAALAKLLLKPRRRAL